MALSPILVIDDNQDRISQIGTVLDFMEQNYRTVEIDALNAAVFQEHRFSAVFIGGERDQQDRLVTQVNEWAQDLAVILLQERSDMTGVSTLVQKKVSKILQWPTRYPLLKETLNNLAPMQQKPVISGSRQSRADKGLAGNSERIKLTRQLIDQVAGSDATVLILGESGTGKEVVAQAIHKNSSRKNAPFVPVNCGAIPGELLESELFGHEKGAFTGALTARQGRFEMAEGGTLFLDEIGDMPMPMQVKLLRVLQERTFERVGSNKTIQCNVRIIAATHRHLENEIKEQRFREDLFYRLNVFPIDVPSLRERPEDIPWLVNDLIRRMHKSGRGRVKLTADAIAVLMQHDWPGNIRELANLIERLAIIYPEKEVQPEDLPEKFQEYAIPEGFSLNENIEWAADAEGPSAEPANPPQVLSIVDAQTTTAHLPDDGIDLKEYLSQLESDLIKQALEECNGVVAHAAKLLNMRRTTLVEKLKKYDLSA